MAWEGTSIFPFFIKYFFFELAKSEIDKKRQISHKFSNWQPKTNKKLIKIDEKDKKGKTQTKKTKLRKPLRVLTSVRVLTCFKG